MSKEITLITATDASGDVTSNSWDLVDLDRFSVQVNFTGSDLVGTLTLEASNDDTNFITVTDSSQAVSASTDHLYDVTAGYRYVRLFWDYTSGSGNISAKVLVKEPKQQQ